MFSKVNISFNISSALMQLSISPNSYHHVSISVFVLVTTVMNIKYYLTLALVYVSVMINDAMELCKGLLAICMSSLEKVYLNTFNFSLGFLKNY